VKPITALLVGLAVVVPLAACGGGDSTTSSRPTTNARLEIVSPTPNEVTGSDVLVKLNLTGAKVVPLTTKAVNGTEGHIHVSIDGRLVSMLAGTTQVVHGIKPGNHSMQAQFVATDHQPFANDVRAGVLFTSK
jgi:hypothetical protein